MSFLLWTAFAEPITLSGKIKLPLILTAKVVLFRNSKNCKRFYFTNKIMGRSVEQGRGILFYKWKGKSGGLLRTKKIHWSKLGVWSIVAFHWLNCDSLLLAGCVAGAGEGEKFSSSCWYSKVIHICKLYLFLLGMSWHWMGGDESSPC